MKKVFFIYPNPNKSNPRGIRINNIVKNLEKLEPKNEYSVLSFSDSLRQRVASPYKINRFNLVYLLFKYTGVFKIGRKLSKTAKTLDPYIFIHFLIKIDIINRVKNLKKNDELVFIVVVSPFSNYLLIPWLRLKYPNSKIICDLGDPLYNNSARKRDKHQTKKIETNGLKYIDNLIVTNSATRRYMINEYNLNTAKLNVIPQGVNLNLILNAEKKVQNIMDRTLVYAGSFYKNLRSPNELFKVLNSQEAYKIYIYGGQVGVSTNQIIYEGKLDQKALFESIQSKQIIVYIDNKFGIQTSGKIYEVLSFNKPVLFIQGDERSEPYMIAKDYPNIFFAYNNYNSIKQAINKITSTKTIKYSGDRLKHSWKNRGLLYEDIINKKQS